MRVVWLGGFGDEASYKVWQNRMGELNGRADISAWRTLLEAPVDLLHIPTWPAPAKILVDPTSFGEELRALGQPVASYLAEILQPLAVEYEDRPGKELWDLACVPPSPIQEPHLLSALVSESAFVFAEALNCYTMASEMIRLWSKASSTVLGSRTPTSAASEAACIWPPRTRARKATLTLWPRGSRSGSE